MKVYRTPAVKKWLLALSCVIWVFNNVGFAAGAALIDDFTISATVRPVGVDIADAEVTAAVGDLEWSRTAYLYGEAAKVMGLGDVNDTLPSVFFARIENVTRKFPNSPPVLAAVIDYKLPSLIDPRAAGLYDSVVLDLAFLRGARQPDFVRGFMLGGRGSSATGGSAMEYRMYNPEPSETPFRIIMPFDQFTRRGSTDPGAFRDSYRIDRVRFEFYWIFQEGQFDWSVGIDQIRFANTALIPEPGTWLLVAIGAALAIASCNYVIRAP